jgi:hypothetical protein
LEDLDFDQVATLLSELSQPSAMPKLPGKQMSPSPFDVEEVDFKSSEWLARVVDVTIWLNLDVNFELENPPQAVAAKLFDELSPRETEASFKIEGGYTLLTEVGAQVLEERLSRAATNRADFLQMLEEEVSLSKATDAWIDAWNEALLEEPMSINASVTTWRISDFAGRARMEQLDLNPTYQRDFVWSNIQSQMLIESVLRGIPLPSIILARASDSQLYQIVDGKQRVTAILRFMGAHPEGRKGAGKMKDFALYDSNFAKFAKRNHLRGKDFAEKYLPFRTRKCRENSDPLRPLGGRYYCEIRDEKVQIGGEKLSVADLFEQACDYLLPVLIYKDTKVRDIHRVFQIYNQQGMKLNAEEIRNAVFNHLMISRLVLFVGGDRPEVDIAPELARSGIDPTTAHENIQALGFGVTRFRRAKVLLWTFSTLFLKPSQGKDKSYRTPSTASHIDEFLRSVDDSRLPQFKNSDTLKLLAKDFISALELLQSSEAAWHERFRSKKGIASRWEELPVIATLTACMILVITGEGSKLEENLEKVRMLTSKLVGPESTQNKTQWAHIANASLSILEVMGVNIVDADVAVRERYGVSALEALLEIRKIPIN